MTLNELFNLVMQANNEGQAFVPFAEVNGFCNVCEAVGMVVCGGAFDADMTGQYFYLEYRDRG